MIITLITILGFALWLKSQNDRRKNELPTLADGRSANPVQNGQGQANLRGREPGTIPIRAGAKEVEDPRQVAQARYAIQSKWAVNRQTILDQSREPEIPFRTLKSSTPDHPALARERQNYMHPGLTAITPTLHLAPEARDLPENALVRPHSSLPSYFANYHRPHSIPKILLKNKPKVFFSKIQGQLLLNNNKI